jgi:hypothetical protein
VTAKNAKLLLYADGTSYLIANPSPTEFASKLNKILLMLMNGSGIICYV